MKSKFIPTKDLVIKALQFTIENGGATMNPRTGEFVVKGYAVGGIREFKIHDAKIGDLDEITEACKKIRAEHRTCMLGFWMDNGTLYIDAVKVCEKQEIAEAVAEAFEEIAYFDLNTNTEIRLK